MMALLGTAGAASASSIVFAGIDAEDGGPGGHGPTATYCQLINSMLADVDGTKASATGGIAVLGTDGATGDSGPGDFYAAVAGCVPQTFTYVDGDTDITAEDFTNYRMLIVVGSVEETFGNALDQDEQDALVGRNSDITAHVNAGGALLGWTQTGLTNQYQYVGGVGALTGTDGLQYQDITPTPAGTARGITDTLDLCCWHNDFSTVPSGFDVLAFREASGDAAAIGTGNAVSTEDCTNGVDDDGDGDIDGADSDCAVVTPENCTNGIDDDGDGDIDAADTDCQEPEGPVGDATCSDGIDNDGDGDTDAADTDCQSGPGGPTCFGMPATGGPTPGNDVIFGTSSPDVINALAGNDAICGLPGDDVLQGNNGADRIRAGNGNDDVGGEQGNDEIYGGVGTDNVRGASGNDYVNGQNDRDTVTGGDNDDRLFGGSGNDTLRGGPGFDVCTGNSGTDSFQGCEQVTDFVVGETNTP